MESDPENGCHMIPIRMSNVYLLKLNMRPYTQETWKPTGVGGRHFGSMQTKRYTPRLWCNRKEQGAAGASHQHGNLHRDLQSKKQRGRVRSGMHSGRNVDMWACMRAAELRHWRKHCSVPIMNRGGNVNICICERGVEQ